ncbi:MAG TPA: ATP-binding cassette domain-containing protein [Chromatiales bacterium]|nr:ATP-binding cassette domain-containing protein [Chromatiales bacterium]
MGFVEQTLDTSAAATAEDLNSRRQNILACVSELLGLLGHPESATALQASFPAGDPQQDLRNLLRLLYERGVHAGYARRRVGTLSAAYLPAVVFLKQGGALLLRRIDAEANAVVRSADLPQRDIVYSIAELEALADGHVLFGRPMAADTAVDSAPDLLHAGWHGLIGNTFKSALVELGGASLLINLLQIAVPLFIMQVYDRVIPNEATSSLVALVVGVVLVLVLDFVLRSVRGSVLAHASTWVERVLSKEVFARLVGRAMPKIPQATGRASAWLQDLERLREASSQTVLTLMFDLPFVALFLMAIYFVAGSLVWVPIVAIPLMLGWAMLAAARLSRLSVEQAQASADRNAFLIETLRNEETAKLNRLEGRLTMVWDGSAQTLSQLSRKIRQAGSTLATGVMLIQQLTMVGLVSFGAISVINGDLTVGALIAVVLLSGRGLAPLQGAVQALVQFKQGVIGLSALQQVLEQPGERDADVQCVATGRLRGDLALQDVRFRYSDDQPWLLDNASLQIAAGEVVGIVGGNGSGKTTLSRLLLGLQHPDSGSIRVDDVDVNHIDVHHLRGQIAMVPQDVVLFSGTLRENIVLGAPWISDERIQSAAASTGISEFIARLPRGYDTRIGESGVGLSAGQRQAIALTRALLIDPRVLILDEATSALDQETSARVIATLKRFYNGRTGVIISHNQDLLQLCSRIVQLKDGVFVNVAVKGKETR